jgi:hypothetical protein
MDAFKIDLENIAMLFLKQEQKEFFLEAGGIWKKRSK